MSIALCPFVNQLHVWGKFFTGSVVDRHYVVLNRFTGDMNLIHGEVWVGVTRWRGWAFRKKILTVCSNRLQWGLELQCTEVLS